MSKIIQETFIIPDEVIAGVNEGLLKRFGGVVRYATGPQKGSIFLHLKPVDKNIKKNISELTQRALSFAKGHPVGTIATIAVVSVAVGSSVVYYIIKKHVPKDINVFRKELTKYLESIRNGELSVDQINALLCSIEKLKKRKDFNDISVELSISEMLAIMQYLHNYTIKLSQDNAVDVNESELMEETQDGVIISLEKHLNAQKKVFEPAS